MEWIVPSPTIVLEVFIKGQNVRAAKLARQMNQACVGEVDVAVTILSEDIAHLPGRLCQRKRYLNNSCRHIRHNRFSRTIQPSQQVATFRDYCFTSNQRRFNSRDFVRTHLMEPFASIKRSYDHSRVKQDRFQRPKSLRCFLLEPKSRIPEANFPCPMILRRPFPRWQAASNRNPSRTTLDGLQPSCLMSCASVFCEDSSSLA